MVRMGSLGRIAGATSGPRTTGSQRTTTVTTGPLYAQLPGHTPHRLQVAAALPGSLTQKRSWELRLGITVETTENREGGS
jgi:hypothetical protein